MNAKPADVDGYLAALPDQARDTLLRLRGVVKAAAPDAVESINYGMPAYKYQGKPLIYFGAAKQHLAVYGVGEGTIRFTPAEPLTPEYVTALINARIADIEAAAAKRKKK